MTRARRSRWRGWIAPLALVLLVIASLTLGKYPLPPQDVLAIILAKITGAPSGLDATAETVVWNIRLPRVVAALLVGAALAAAGAAYQGMFRNPLVSPDILGVSAGASLGAVLGIFLSLPILAIQGFAFAGGLMTVLLVTTVAAFIRRHDRVLTLVLAGIAVGAMVGAAIALLKILADPYDQLPAITFWLLGSLTATTYGDVLSTLPAILIGLAPLVLLRWRINLMTLDDEEARALGVDTRTLRFIVIAAATLMTSAAVSITGVIGWVGLIIPHAARLLVGPDFSRLLPAALMLGGGYLVLVDAIARSIATIEIPLGILTAALGAPVLLWLLATMRRGWQ